MNTGLVVAVIAAIFGVSYFRNKSKSLEMTKDVDKKDNELKDKLQPIPSLPNKEEPKEEEKTPEEVKKYWDKELKKD